MSDRSRESFSPAEDQPSHVATRRVLITGATGFVGSALAANLLTRSAHVLALARNDPGGQRTRAAVKTAAAGFGIDLALSTLARLDIIDGDPNDLVSSLDPDRLATVTDVWHSAAEMSFSWRRLASSFKTNVGMTTALYTHVRTHAPCCRRFYYVSTAYVSGIAGGPVVETLHFNGDCTTSYLVTKRCAEQALALVSRDERLPVTLFRPSCIVGHEDTGWAVRNDFGLYMFVEAMNAVRDAGGRSLTLTLNAAARPDLVPINRIVGDALALTGRADAGSSLEIFHGSAGLGVTVGEAVAVMAACRGVAVRYGGPESLLDHEIAAILEVRLPFANTEWQFDRARLDAALGRPARPPIDRRTLQRLIAWYCGDVTTSLGSP